MAEEAPQTTPPPAADEAPNHGPPAAEGGHQAPDTSDLLSSAKTLAEAAQAAASKNTDSIDKAKVAEAAENILEAARGATKLDDKEGVGQYLDKAEGYLHSMHSGGDSGGKKEEKEKEEESGGGGFMKMAGSFFK